MSFVVTVYVPEAIVMASDSRQFITVEGKDSGGKPFKIETVSSDASYKTFLLERHGVGINSFGNSLLGGISIESHVRRFSEEKLREGDDAAAVAEKLVANVKAKFTDADTHFHVAGFNKDGLASVPHVYYCHVGRNEVRRKNVGPDDDEVQYGATWGGQPDVMSRLVNATHVRGDDGQSQEIRRSPIIWDAMNVQDAIDFAIYAVRTTIDTMRFEARAKTVDGQIDVLLLTPSGPSWVQKKGLHGQT